MIIIPAIDLKEGRCVRLEQGLMEKDTVYSDDPAAQAKAWQDQGGELVITSYSIHYTKLYENKKLSIVAMLAGGLVALSGKILISIYGFSWGNWMIAAAFGLNFLILRIPENRKGLQ